MIGGPTSALYYLNSALVKENVSHPEPTRVRVITSSAGSSHPDSGSGLEEYLEKAILLLTSHFVSIFLWFFLAFNLTIDTHRLEGVSAQIYDINLQPIR